MEESWRQIPGYKGYEASDLGRVRSYYKRGGKGTWYIADTPQRILAQAANPNGKRPSFYKFVNLGRGKTVYVHRLVLLAFRGKRPEGLEGCHNDGDPENNHLSNLRYDTHESNMKDAVRHGVYRKRGQTRERVEKMRFLRHKGVSAKELAEYFKLSPETVRAICSGRAYADVGGEITKRVYKLSKDDVVEIRRIYLDGRMEKRVRERERKSMTQLAKEYGVSLSMISRIISNEKYKD